MSRSDKRGATLPKVVAAKPTEEVKKSDGFAFPGDPSVNLRMTQLSLRDPMRVVAIPAIKVGVACIG